MVFNTLLLLATTLAVSTAMPYRQYQSQGQRSVHPVPLGLEDYIVSYLQALKQQQKIQQLQQMSRPYYLQRKQLAPYEQGYIQEQPSTSYAEAIAALPILPYVNGRENDYTADYDDNSYNSDDGIWYDDDIASNDIYNDKRSNDDKLALAQLYLDSLNGKYSMEDLETLVREATYEDNTEEQLHHLMDKKVSKKSSNLPVLEASSERVAMPQTRGQKEEALNIPATTIRKPAFAHQTEEPEEKKMHPVPLGMDKSTQNQQESTESPEDTETDDDEETETPEEDNDSSEDSEDSSVRPYMKSAYEALKDYLDKERHSRQKEDESHMPQKRFISDPASLTEQLSSLKKNTKA